MRKKGEIRKLDIIKEPKELSRAIVHGVGNKIPPMFEGEGNINYLCSHCETTLAKDVSESSISNIVVECPSCHSYNEFPLLSNSGYAKVLLTKGNYNFSGAVKLRKKTSIEGQ